MSLAAFIFDFDGTLIDTETAGFNAVRDVFREHGADAQVEWWAPAVGASYSPDYIGELERQLGRTVNAAAVSKRVRALNSEYVADAPLRPGVSALLDDAAANGLGLAVASNAPGDWIAMHLSRVGLLVQHGKPHPEPFATAAKALGVKPSECVAFEDSNLGVHSAVAAGIFTVAVPGALTGHLHELDHAHLIVDSLVEVTVEVARGWLV
jgi:HAD superfamily hydrolase (TIGR01509 family)